MKIILISNYPKDNQESMQRFAQMLNSGFQKEGYQCTTWQPIVYFGSFFKSTKNGIGKWAGYIDKWIIFPLILKLRVWKIKEQETAFSFHICDHSNSPYLKHLPPGKTVITCHDVIAIRCAFGYEGAYCKPSPTGKVFQKWIFRNLSAARRLAAVSGQTMKQLQQLMPVNAYGMKEWRIIYHGFNNDFKIGSSKHISTITEAGGTFGNVPFLLHLGSGHGRKNRKLLVDMIEILGDKWNGKICFAGEEVDRDLQDYATSRGLANRIISVKKPDHQTLIELYRSCDAFVFPSFSEGFGWPVIEAQSCGTPVIASHIETLREISGGAALYGNPYKPGEFADAFSSLSNQDLRQSLIKKGFENCTRFDNKNMIDAYLELHGFESSIKSYGSGINSGSSSLVY